MLAGALGAFLKNMDIGALRLAQVAVRGGGKTKGRRFGRAVGGWFMGGEYARPGSAVSFARPRGAKYLGSSAFQAPYYNRSVTARAGGQLNQYMWKGTGMTMDPFSMGRAQRVRMATRMGAVGGGLLGFSASGNFRRRHPTLTMGATLGGVGYGLSRFVR
jgi:hypothetical protein